MEFAIFIAIYLSAQIYGESSFAPMMDMYQHIHMWIRIMSLDNNCSSVTHPTVVHGMEPGFLFLRDAVFLTDQLCCVRRSIWFVRVRI